MVLLSICLIFCQFQPDVAYKSVAYKKSVYLEHNFTVHFKQYIINLAFMGSLHSYILLTGIHEQDKILVSKGSSSDVVSNIKRI